MLHQIICFDVIHQPIKFEILEFRFDLKFNNDYLVLIPCRIKSIKPIPITNLLSHCNVIYELSFLEPVFINPYFLNPMTFSTRNF